MITNNGAKKSSPLLNDYDLVLTVIMEQIAQLTTTENQNESSSFLEMGITSVLGVDLIELINQRFSLALGPETIYDYQTPEKLASWLVTQIEPKGETEQNVDLLQLLQELIKGLINTDTLDEDKSFLELGFGSVLGVELIDLINQKLNLSLGPEIIYDYPTPEKMASWLATQAVDQKTIVEFDVVTLLSELIEQLTEVSEPDFESSFLELGFGSVLGVELIEQVNEKLGTDLGPEIIYDYQTPEKLASWLNTQLQNQAPETVDQVDEKELPEVQTETSIQNMNDIAIIGMSGRFPGSENLESYWEHIKNGDCCIREIDREGWDSDQFYHPDLYHQDTTISKWAGLLPDMDLFDPLFFQISPQEAERMDPQQRLFLEESIKTVENAGYSLENLEGENVAVYVGVRSSDYKDRTLREEEAESKTFLGNDSAILAGRISYFLDLKGPNLVVDTACSSSLVSVHLACESIKRGESEMALAGGVFVMPSPEFLILCSKTEMLSPDGKCKSFDQTANGIVVGEGVGALLLKPLGKAMEDGDHIHAVIKGTTINQDGRTNGITAPSFLSQAALLEKAYTKSGVSPESIGYMEAHGTGTKLGDPIEIKALTETFRKFTDKTDYCVLGTHKPNFGHTIMTAGIAGLFKIVLATQARFIPPSIHVNELNEHIKLENSPFRIETTGHPWLSQNGAPLRAGVSSFGFSGTNCHVIIEEAPLRQQTQTDEQQVHFFPFSAKTGEALLQKLVDFREWIEKQERKPALIDASYTLLCGRSHFPWRFALIAKDWEELSQQLDVAIGKYKGNEEQFAYTGTKKSKQEVAAWKESGKLLLEELSVATNRTKEGYHELIALYESGVAQAWETLHSQNGKRTPLPTYPFAKEQYWIGERGMGKREKVTVPLFQKEWIEESITINEGELHTKADTILLVGQDRNELNQYQTNLTELTGKTVISVQLQTNGGFNRKSDLKYSINVAIKADYVQLLRNLLNQGKQIASILYLGTTATTESDSIKPVEAILQSGTKSLLFLAQALIEARIKNNLKLVYLYQQREISNSVEEYTQSMHGALSGLLKTAHQEIPNFFGQVLRVDRSALTGQNFIPRLVRELSLTDKNDVEVRYQGKTRLIAQYDALADVPRKVDSPNNGGDSDKVYLITGGSGKLGQLFAKHLAKKERVTLVLTGRSSMDQRIQSFLNEFDQKEANVIYLQSDISKREEVQQLISTIKSRFGAIHGIFHCAGVILDNFLLNKTEQEVDRVLASKIWGTIWLDELTRQDSLDYFVLFSSISAALGNIGQIDYAFANAFLDEIAKNRSQLHQTGKTVSINWPLWEEGGHQMNREEFDLLFGEFGLKQMATNEGMLAWDTIEKSSLTNCLVTCGDSEAFGKFLRNRCAQYHESKSEPVRETIATSELSESIYRKTEQSLTKLLSELFKIQASKLRKEVNFQEYGIDSIMVNRFNAKIEEMFQLSLSKTLLYEYTNIEELSGFLSEEHGQAIAKALGVETVEETKKVQKAPESSPATTSARTAPKQLYSQKNQNGEPVAIIGISGRYPQAGNLDEYWNNLKNGQDCVRTVPTNRWDAEALFDSDQEKANLGKIYCKWGGFIDDIDCFDPLFFKIAPREAETMDPQERLFLEVTWETLEDAGYSLKTIESIGKTDQWSDVAVYVGVTNYAYPLLGEYETNDDQVQIPISLPWSIANRVSFALNFKGPSIPVDTACSSSLTAVHLACESLRKEESEMAIAGGVNLFLHHSKYLWMCQMRMLSPDGKCHSFGKRGNGFVPGEGVGAVLLKTLSKAERDRDQIYGVIRGSSINHGGNTNGYTVPNPNAQAALIKEALRHAEIDPESISYVEAHGTGTALGDPIEITGLTKAYRNGTGNGQYCAIGSVKSNMGHLEAAAGIAGITKILLQFKHKKLVPSLHCEDPNPNIDFATTPFYLQKELKSWTRPENGPRRAAISSFGAGGVNAHAILEEYPRLLPVTAEESVHPQLIVLSAKNEERLRALAQNLLGFVNKAGDINLRDLAYTLQVGREAMEERLAFLACGWEELHEKLTLFCQNKSDDLLIRGNCKKSKEGSILLQGRAGEEYLRITIEDQQWEQLAHLWVSGIDFDWEQLHLNGPLPQRISLPTYPFAKKRYWIRKEKREPKQEGKALLHPLVGENISTLKKMAFRSFFTGKEFFLNDHLVHDQKILPGVAYLEMARAAGEMADEGKVATIDNVVWAKPISVALPGQEVQVHLNENRRRTNVIDFEVKNKNPAGQFATCAQGRLTIGESRKAIQRENIQDIRNRCSQSISSESCYQNFAQVGLNYGVAFQTIEELRWNDREAFSLVRLPKEDQFRNNGWKLHPSILDGALQTVTALTQNENLPEGTPLLPFSLEKIEIFAPVAECCYVQAQRVQSGSGNGEILKFNLRIFNENGDLAAAITNFGARLFHQQPVARKSASPLLFFTPSWKNETLPSMESGERISQPVLLFDRDEQLYFQLKSQCSTLILVKPGNEYRQLNDLHYEINPDNSDDYTQLLQQLKQKELLSGFMIHNWTKKSEFGPTDTIDTRLDLTIGALVKATQAWLTEKTGEPLRLLSLGLGNDRDVSAIHGGLGGFFRSVRQENPKLRYLLLTGDRITTDQILKELLTPEEETTEVRYLNGERQVATIEQIETAAPAESVTIETGKTWLITGGLGGLGFLFAKELAEKHNAKLILWGQSPVDASREKKLQTLKALTSSVLYQQVDLSEKEAVQAALESAKKHSGPVHGVIHCAGVNRDSLVQKKTDAEWKAVLEPKVVGTIHLDQLLQSEPLEHFILFSSIAGAFGNLGQSDYAFANRFLNRFAEQRQQQVMKGEKKGKTQAICWPLWRHGGMRVDEQSELRMEKQLGLKTLLTEDGINSFYQLLRYEQSQIGVVTGDFNKIKKQFRILSSNQPAKKVEQPKTAKRVKAPQTAKSLTPEALQNKVETELSQILANVLKVEPEDLEPDEELLQYGLDSIMMITVLNLLEDSYGEVLDPSILSEYNMIRTLAERLIELGIPQQNDPSLLEEEEKLQVEEVNLPEPEPEPVAYTAAYEWQPIPEYQETEQTAATSKIAVIGLSCRFPQSNNPESFWQNLKAGKELITEIPENRWSVEEFYHPDREQSCKSYSKWGGFLDDVYSFDASFFGISETDAMVMDPHHRLVLELSEELFRDAGFAKERLSGKSVSIYIGGGESHYMKKELSQVPNEYTKHLVVNTIPNMMAARISDFYDLKGISTVVDTACSSSLVAVHQACDNILNGQAEMAIAGGVELHLAPDSHIKFSKAEVLSEDGHSYVFDRRAKGFTLGEGAGLVLLKSYDQAVVDGDKIHGVILGSAVNNDGHTMGLTVPGKDGQKEVIRQALKQSQISPETITMLEAHGTGTLLGDPIEIQAISQVYRNYTEKQQFCAVGSVKSNMGHLLRAAGVASLIKVLLALKHKTIPATLNCETPHARFQFEDSPFYPAQSSQQWQPVDGVRRAAISSFGFGGTNCHLILEEGTVNEPWDSTGQTVPTPEYDRKLYRLGDETVSTAPIHTFRFDEPYLKAHEIFGQQVLLGVTNCGFVIDHALAERKDETPFRLHRFLFTELVQLKKNESASLALHVEQEEERKQKVETRFKISSTGAYQQNTATELYWDSDFTPVAVDLDSFLNQSERVITKEQFRGKRLLECQPCLHVVEKVFVRGNESLGLLKVGEAVKNGTYPFRVHPALLNGAFIAIMSAHSDELILENDPNAMWVPFMIKDIHVQAPLPEECYCHGKIDRVTPDLLVISYSFHDLNGKVLLSVEEFTHRLVRRDDFRDTTKELQPEQKPVMAAVEVVEPVNGANDIESYLTQKLKKQISGGSNELDKNTNFMLLGIESNSMIQLAQEIEQEIEIELYPTLFFEYQNIEELVRYFQQEHAEAFTQYFARTGKRQPAAKTASIPTPRPAAVIQEPVAEKPEIKEAGKEKTDLREESIAVIGMAFRFAGSETAEEFWNHLEQGDNLVSEVPETHWDWKQWFDSDREAPNKTYSKWGSFIEADRFDPTFFGITPREATWLDPQLRQLLEVTHAAGEDAGYGKRIKGTNTGMFVGASLKEYWDEILQRNVPFENHQANSGLLSTLPGRVSFTFDLRGPSLPVDTACSSSLMAVHLACQSLRSGDCDMAFAAGVGILISPLHYIYVSRMQAFSPTGQCHSFDEKADGYVPGEGIATLLLKPLKKAVEDQDQIHAVIRGSSMNHVGRSNNPTSPRTELQTELLLEAWKNADIDPETITCLEAHGTGTVLGDPIEVNALVKAFRAHTTKSEFCALGTAKATLGHLGSAAGMAGMIKTILSMKHGKIPVMPTFDKLNPYINLKGTPFVIQKSLTDWTPPAGVPRRAGVSAFGLAGSNAHVVLEEFIVPNDEEQSEAKDSLLLFSAKNRERLRELLLSYQQFLKNNTPSLERLAYTLMEGREAMEERIAFVVSTQQELAQTIDNILHTENRDDIFEGRVRGQQNSEETDTTLVNSLIAQRNLRGLAKLWVSGVNLNWQQLESKKQRPLSLPTYPFAKEKYWAAPLKDEFSVERQAETVAVDLAEEKNFYFLPEWQQVVSSGGSSKTNKRVLLVNAPQNIPFVAAFKALQSVSEVSELQIDQHGTGLDSLATLINADQKVDEVIFLGGIQEGEFSENDSAACDEAQQKGLLSLLRLIQAMDGQSLMNEELCLKVVTNNLFEVIPEEQVRPQAAALCGLAKTVATEYPELKVATIDLTLKGVNHNSKEQLLQIVQWIDREQGSSEQLREVAVRNEKRYRLRTVPTTLNASENSPLKQGGTYLILGGAGRVGMKMAEMLHRDYQAKLILIGRSTLTTEKEQKLDQLKAQGAKLLYLQADLTDSKSLKNAIALGKEQFGAIQGIFHAAMVEKNALIQNHDETGFQQGLLPKIQGSVSLMEALQGETPDFLLFFSSSQSFIAQAGMSNYVAGNYFQDALAYYLDRTKNYPVRTINWGVWNVNFEQLSEANRRSIRTMGFHPIAPEKAMNAIARTLAAPFTQVIAIEGEEYLLRKMGLEKDELHFYPTESIPAAELTELKESFHGMRSFSADLLLNVFQQAGLLRKEGERHETKALKAKLNVIGKYDRLFDEMIRILSEYNFIRQEGATVVTTAAIEDPALKQRLLSLPEEKAKLDQKHPTVKAYTNLVWVCLQEYARILDGSQSPTELIFPNYSMELVDGIYRDNPKSDYYNRLTQRSLLRFLDQRIPKLKEGEKIRIIEIGAGTGGTSRTLFKALRPHQQHLEYVYTDISQGFTRYGKKEYGAENPYVRFQVLNIEEEVQNIGEIAQGAFDLVIATNVLHATRNMEETMTHVRSLLKESGCILVNECTSIEECATLTFGLLDGWWLYDDEADRLPGTPLLSQNNWNSLLKRVGFHAIGFLGEELCSEQSGKQNVIIAENRESAAFFEQLKKEEQTRPAVETKAEPPTATEEKTDTEELLQTVEEQIIETLAATLELPTEKLDSETPFTNMGVDSILSLEIVKAINQRLQLKLTSTILFNYSTVELLAKYIVENFQDKLAVTKKPEKQVTPATATIVDDTEELTRTMEEQIKETLALVLEMPRDQFDEDTPFTNLGVDSILSLEIVKAINQNLGLNLTSTILFNYSTIERLAQYIVENHRDKLVKPAAPVVSKMERETIQEETPRKEEKTAPITATTTTQTDNEIAVIGMSGLFPGAMNLEEFWNNLTQGKNSIESTSRWELDDFYDEDPKAYGKSNSKWGGFLKEIDMFDPLFFGISPKEADYMDPQQRLFLQESWKALEDAGYSNRDLEGTKCSVYVGFNASDYHRIIDKEGFVSEAQRLTGNYEAMLSSRLSYFLNLRGPTLTVNTACSSSLVALHMACENLRNGNEEMALAGGASIMTTPEFFILLSTTDVLSPEGNCRAFDDNANGIALGEGVGCVVLKPLKAAIRDQDHIYGVIAGSGINHDGKTNGITAPSAPAQAALEVDVYRRFQINPDQISYVETHGTGTRLGDPIEIDALTDAWRQFTPRTQFCPIGSLKSNLGHTLAFSGIAGVMKLMLCLQHKKLVPSLHFSEPNRLIDFENSPFYVNTHFKDWEPEAGNSRIAAVSSFGFSGTNCHVVVREVTEQDVQPKQTLATGQPRLIGLSAKSTTALLNRLETLIQWLEKNGEQVDLNDLSYTLMVGRSQFPVAFAVVGESITETVQQLKSGLNGLKLQTAESGTRKKKPDQSIRKEGEQWIEAMKTGSPNNEAIRQQLSKLAKLYGEGYQLNWKNLYHEESPHRLSLPTYPFDQERHWVNDQKTVRLDFQTPTSQTTEEDMVKELMKQLEVGDITVDKACQMMEGRR